MRDDIKEILTAFEHLHSCKEESLRQSILNGIIAAIDAQRGLSKQFDAGPWVVSEDGCTLSSDDFEHDVTLKVGGDFYSDEQRAAYTNWLANRLTGLPKEPPPALLWSMAMRMRHDFGLDADDTSPIASGFTAREREVMLDDMRKLYEEVAGHGFFKWS